MVLFVGCSERVGEAVLSEKDEGLYQDGLGYNRSERKKEALNAFLKLIERRRDAPESHLEAGRIYLEDMSDPITAIYHFRKYLEAKPDVEQSRIVKQLIETAKKAFIKTLPGRNDGNEYDRVDILRLLKETRNENLKLRQLITQMQSEAGSRQFSVVSGESVGSTLVPVFAKVSDEQKRRVYPEYYTVKQGDSLSKISQSVYGTSLDWQRIYEANRDLLPTAHALKVGQVLKIPPKAR